MKIAIDISQVAYKGTGVAVYTENLVKHILSIDEKNSYILFGSSLRNKKKLIEFCEQFREKHNCSYKIFSFPPSFLSLLWNKMHVFPIENLIGKADILHTSDWLEPPSRAIKVTTIHDLVVFVDPESTPKSIVSTQLKKLSWVANESKKLIAVSNSTKKDIIKYLKIPDENISVIYEASNIKKINDQKLLEKVKVKYKLPEKFLLVVGTGKRKNLENIIKAFEKLNNDFHLVIIGELGQNSNNLIHGLGFISEEELSAVYTLAKVLVYVPTYEGFGLPVLEAISCDCQVVASNVSSLPEVGGDAVFYTDPFSIDDIVNNIKEAINHPKTNLISQSLKFNWEKTAKETIDMYESLS